MRAPADVELAELVDVLRSRPGRGGVRLSYRQAELALQLVGAARELTVERRHLRDAIRRQSAQRRELESQLLAARMRLAEATRA